MALLVHHSFCSLVLSLQGKTGELATNDKRVGYSSRSRPNSPMRSTSKAIIDQGFVSGGNFLTIVIATRFLGLEAFGVLALCLLLVTLAQSLQQALILTPMLSVGPKRSANTHYFAPLFAAQALCALISAFVIASIILYAGPIIGITPASPRLAFAAAFAVLAIQLHEFFRRKAFAQHRTSAALRLDALRYSLQLTALPSMYHLGHTSVSATLALMGSSALLASGFACRQLLTFTVTKAELASTIRAHWQMAKWLLPSVLAQWTGTSMFTIVVGVTLGATSAGALRAAQTLLGLVAAFFQAMDNLHLPRAAQLVSERGRNVLREYVPTMIKFYVLVSVPILLLVAVPSKLWMSLLYGPEYAGYGHLVVGLAVNQFLIACALPFSIALRAMEKTLPILLSHAVVSVFALTASWGLASQFGLSGIVLGLTFSQATILIILSTAYVKLVKPL